MDDSSALSRHHREEEEARIALQKLRTKVRRYKMSVPPYHDNLNATASQKQIDLKNEDEADALSIAKDRGQVTMTSAMSMTNIALLKAVLDRGPEKNRFYILLLTLTSLALSLQVLAGILSLCVSQLRNYYQKFHDSVRPRVQCCPIAVLWRSSRAGGRVNTTLCCPCHIEIVSDQFKNHELSVIDAWKVWVEEDTEHDMNAAEADIMLSYLDRIISSMGEKLEQMSREKNWEIVEEEKGEIGRLKEDIENAYRRRAVYCKVKQESDGSNAKGNIFSIAMHNITRNHALKRAQTWQYVINVMLYCSFIISAFLTGIGLAS